MWKQIALNVFYNLGIILSGLGVYWTFNNKQYLFSAFFAAALILFVFLKSRLIKAVRKSFKPKG